MIDHTLTVRPVFVRLRAPSIPAAVDTVAGYRAMCACGQESPQVATPQLAQAWHAYHVDPTGRKALAVRKGIR